MLIQRHRKSAPAHGWWGRERERERAHALWLLFLYVFFLPPGPALCKFGSGRSAVLPEVLTLVLGPSFDLPLFYFHGLYPSLSFTLPPFWTAFPYSHHLTHPFLVDSGGSLEAKSYPTLGIPLSVAHQAPLSMGFFRQEYWSGLPFPSPGESSRPRNWTPVSHIACRFFTSWAMRESLSWQSTMWFWSLSDLNLSLISAVFLAVWP